MDVKDPETLLSLWHGALERDQSAPFLAFEAVDAEKLSTIGFGTVFRRACRFANALKGECGLEDGGTVLVVGGQPLSTAISVHGVLLAGLRLVYTATSISNETLLHHLINTKANVVVFPMELSARVAQLFTAVPRVSHWIVCGGSRGGQGVIRKFDDLIGNGEETEPEEAGAASLLVFTPGTQLGQRGVLFSEHAVVSSAVGFGNMLRQHCAPRGWVWGLLSPPSLLALVSSYFAPLSSATGSIHLNMPSSGELVRTASAAGIRMMLFDERMLHAIKEFETLGSSDLTAVFFPHGRLQPDRIATARRGAKIFVAYHQTELGGLVSEPGDDSEFGVKECWDQFPLISSGRISERIDLQIMGPLGEELNEGETGQIVVRERQVMEEYCCTPTGDVQLGQDGYVHTGDDGFYLSDDRGFRHLFVSNRQSQIIERAGEQINLSIVRAALLGLDGVAWAEPVAFLNNAVGREIGALVRLVEGSKLTAEQIRDALRSELVWSLTPKVVLLLRDQESEAIISYADLLGRFTPFARGDFRDDSE